MNPAGPVIQQPLPEWSDWRGSELSTLETDVYVWCHALLMVDARIEEKNCKYDGSKMNSQTKLWNLRSRIYTGIYDSFYSTKSVQH